MERGITKEAQIVLPPLKSEDTRMSFEAGRPFSRHSSIRLPSISDSTMCGSEGLDSTFTESEYGGFSGVTSEFDILEEDGGSEGSWPRKPLSLEEREEKEIEKKVKQEFKQEFQKIKEQAQEKQTIIRRKFKSKINKARAALLAARMNAEKETINKLEEEAEKKEAAVLQKRWKRKVEIMTNNKPGMTNPETLTHNVHDLAVLRKIRSQLDRARARRRSTIASTIVASRHGKMTIGMGMWDSEVKRLEKVEEIQKLIFELQNLGLQDSANTLITSLCKKKSSEDELKSSLIDERKKAKMKALDAQEQEIARLRKEKLAEKERQEREKLQREREEKERIERERRRKMMEALKRKAFNQSLRKSLEEAKFTTSMSRSYTYSYFDASK